MQKGSRRETPKDGGERANRETCHLRRKPNNVQAIALFCIGTSCKRWENGPFIAISGRTKSEGKFLHELKAYDISHMHGWWTTSESLLAR